MNDNNQSKVEIAFSSGLKVLETELQVLCILP